MDGQLTGTWEEFEAWIRKTIGGNFRWKVRPQDGASKREVIAGLITDGIKRNNGTFPEQNSFIARVGG